MKLVMEIHSATGLIRLEKEIGGVALTKDLDKEKQEILNKMLKVINTWEED